jgi:hypothetical protein
MPPDLIEIEGGDDALEPGPGVAAERELAADRTTEKPPSFPRVDPARNILELTPLFKNFLRAARPVGSPSRPAPTRRREAAKRVWRSPWSARATLVVGLKPRAARPDGISTPGNDLPQSLHIFL